MGWNLESDDEAIGNILMETLGAIDTMTKQRGLYDRFIFPNDAYHRQDPLKSFGANAFRKMRGIASTYDPDRVFQTQVPGGFKLWTKSGY